MNRRLAAAAAVVVACVATADNAAAAPLQSGSVYCEKLVTEPSVNAIVRDVFESKVQDLARSGLLPADFWAKNKDLGFAVCDNHASYDTFVVYDSGVVVFDYQMIVFLFAQSRGLMVGRYISQARQFVVHEEVVSQFVAQGHGLDDGPLAIVEKKALALGLEKPTLDKILSDPKFTERELNLFLPTLYFLVMHERCHVALNHGEQREALEHLSEEQKTIKKQQFELDADRCALDIVNADEAQFKGSPIAFFGVMMVVATQAIIANQPNLRTDRSHPSTKVRMDAATDRVLSFVSQRGPEAIERFAPTIKGTAAYFGDLLDRLAKAR